MTKYEFIKAFASACAVMADNHISPADYKYIGLVEDFERMKAEGHKYAFIVSYLSQQYEVNEATVYRIAKRLQEPCK